MFGGDAQQESARGWSQSLLCAGPRKGLSGSGGTVLISTQENPRVSMGEQSSNRHVKGNVEKRRVCCQGLGTRRWG